MFHPLHTDMERPLTLNSPFCYEPHPLCLMAADEVRRFLATRPDWTAEVDAGKMFGVLVCEDSEGQLGFLAAYSGQLLGREDWPWFVPAVFDYLQPDGHFKREEAAITAINQRVAQAEASPLLAERRQQLEQVRSEAEKAIGDYRQLMAEAKARRDTCRDTADTSALIRESQFQKAELRRLKKRWAELTAQAAAKVAPMEEAIARMKEERRQRSDVLQGWLFDHFVMLNSRGEQRTLTAIFATTPQRTPPSGAGECCAPKLLQYAFAHSMKPLAIAEFWQGRSPRMEVRHHNQFYPACRGKCKPILEWMLGECASSRPDAVANSCVPSVASDQRSSDSSFTLYSSFPDFLVVNKPAGLLSVPGLTDEQSVESLLLREHPEVWMVHRLDQDTSGLMVVALNRDTYHHLQRQFLARTIYKKYIALLDGTVGHVGDKGTISLPLRPDPLDRPRQVVDYEHGKEAVTDYEVLDPASLPPVFQHVSRQPGHRYTLVALTPHTGRTHQLRMHCAHADGLNAPIVGDRLYGHPAARMCLHAAELAFDHPDTGERLTFNCLPDF